MVRVNDQQAAAVLPLYFFLVHSREPEETSTLGSTT